MIVTCVFDITVDVDITVYVERMPCSWLVGTYAAKYLFFVILRYINRFPFFLQLFFLLFDLKEHHRMVTVWWVLTALIPFAWSGWGHVPSSTNNSNEAVFTNMHCTFHVK